MKKFNKNEWKKVRLEEICEILDSKRIPIASSERRTGEYPYYGANGIQGYIDDYIFDDDLVLLAEDGGNFGSKVKPIAYKVSGKCWINNHAHVLKANLKELTTDFLCYSLMFYDVSKIVNGTTRIKLTQAAMRKMELWIPQIEVQEKTTKLLDNIVEILEKKKKQLLEIENLSKCLFFEMFSSIDYIKLSLGECTSFIDYRGKTPKLSLDGKIRMINAKSVGKGFFKYINEFVTEEIYNNWMTRGLGQSGDILFVTEGHTFGNVCIIPLGINKFALGQRVITIRGENNKIINDYLYQYMQTEKFEKDINIYKTGGTAQGIRSKNLSKILIPIPPIELQEKFAERIKVIEKSKFEIQQSIDETQKLFDSLMEKYFG